MNIRVHPNVAAVYHFDDFSTTSPHFTPLILHSYAFSCKEKNFFVKKRKKVLGYRTKKTLESGYLRHQTHPSLCRPNLLLLAQLWVGGVNGQIRPSTEG